MNPDTRSVIIGLGAAGLAGILAAGGILSSLDARRALASQAAENAAPSVGLAKIETKPKSDSLSLPGTIQPFMRAPIYARVNGYLKSWNADIGARVRAGAVLAAIDTPDLDQQLAQAKADLVTAEANANLAALTAQRWNSLRGSQAVAQQAVDEKLGDAAAKKALADAARANVARLEAMETFKAVTAPFDGVVTARNTDVGALINAGASASPALFELSALDRVRIYVHVPQALSAGLKAGSNAAIRLPQFPDRSFSATVAATSDALDPASATMLIELQADNPDGAFSAGAYCEVTFDIPPTASSFRLSATALIPVDKGSEVAIVGADGKTALKPVTIGRDFGDTVEILGGVSATDRIIDNPPESLSDGTQVRVTEG